VAQAPGQLTSCQYPPSRGLHGGPSPDEFRDPRPCNGTDAAVDPLCKAVHRHPVGSGGRHGPGATHAAVVLPGHTGIGAAPPGRRGRRGAAASRRDGPAPVRSGLGGTLPGDRIGAGPLFGSATRTCWGSVASARPAWWSRKPGLVSDRQGELVERDGHSWIRRRLDRQLVVASAEVLDEGVPGDDHPGARVLLEPARRTQPRLETAVVSFDLVVGIPVGAVPGRRQQPIEHHRVPRRPVGHDLDRHRRGRSAGPFEEPTRCLKGAQTRSCRSPVLMEQAAEQVASMHSAGLVILTEDGRPGGRIWGLQSERSVRAVPVVMLDVDP
jgi:hypothetical protein